MNIKDDIAKAVIHLTHIAQAQHESIDHILNGCKILVEEIRQINSRISNIEKAYAAKEEDKECPTQTPS